jgi:uncharacterized protein
MLLPGLINEKFASAQAVIQLDDAPVCISMFRGGTALPEHESPQSASIAAATAPALSDGGFEGIQIADLDSHIVDLDRERWHEHLSDASDIPEIVADEAGISRVRLGGLLYPKPSSGGRGNPTGTRAVHTTSTLADQQRFLDAQGISVALVQPGFVGLAAPALPDGDLRRRLARAHNDLVIHYASGDPRLRAVPVMLPDDPRWSIEELRRCRDKAEIAAVVCRPTDRGPRPFADAAANPLIRHLAEAGLLLCLHGGTGYHQASPVADLFDDYIFTHAFSHPIENQTALADIFASRLLEEGLRVAVLEAGCGWVPWFLHRLQAHFSHTAGCAAIDCDVLDVAQRSIVITVEPGEPFLEHVVAELGTGMFAVGTDFPHWDALDVSEIRRFAARFGPSGARDILAGNCERVVGGLAGGAR